MKKTLSIIATLRNPVYWTLITTVLAMFGLPPAVSQALGVIINVAPDIINNGAIAIAAGATAIESWRSKQGVARINAPDEPINPQANETVSG